MRQFALVLFVCVVGTGLDAQVRVGTAVVRGQAVDLFSDHTWRLQGGTRTRECASIASRVRFCGSGSEWSRTTFTTDDIAAQWRYDDRHYGQMIIEGLGSADGVTADYMRYAVIENFATFIGVSASSVPIIEAQDVEVNGLPASMLVYAGELNGMPIVFANTIISGEHMTVQAVTFSVGRAFTNLHKELHEDFLSRVEIE